MSLRNRYARFFRSANARLGSKPRPRYKPSLEGLENRALLSTTSTWTGNGDGTSFNQATNWSPVGVPGPSNDAVINVGSGVTINLPTSGISVNSLMQTNGTLVMPFGSGTFTTTTGLTLKTGILNDNSGSISGGATLINSTLNLTSSSGSAQFVTEGSSTLNGPISSNQPVQVEGVTTDIGGPGNAVLTLGSTATDNGGLILLQSYGSDSYNADSDLAVAGGTTFTNTGTIQVNSSAGSRYLTGNFINAGTINVRDTTSLQVNRNASNYSFTQSSGSIIGTGGLYVEAGPFNVNGGSPLTNVYAQGSTLTVAASETNPTLIYATGGSTTLATNLSTTTTVQVEGITSDIGGLGTAILTLAGGATNAGTIELQSYGSDSYNADSDLAVAGGTTFTNTGTIQVNSSAGSRYLTGNFINAGTINVRDTTSLQVNRNASNYSFTQSSGSIIGTGGLYVEAGPFNVNGGSPLTNVYAQGSTLTVAASETNPTLIYATGGSTTLATNLSTTTTVQVEGITSDTGGLGTAILTLAGGATNAGTIELQSYGTDNYNADSDLAVAGGTIFTNTGIIQVNNSAGSRFITGNFVNAGTINVVGVSLQVNKNASSYSFTQSSGSINGTGGLYVESGAFNVNGGSPLTDVYAQGSILTVAASETNTTLIYATGGSTTLATNLSPTTTIQVEGISSDTGGLGTAILTLAGGATNAGTIELQSYGTDGYNADSDLAVAGGTIFTNTGIIQVNNSAGSRFITGNFVNAGTINVVGVSLQVNRNASSYSFTLASGSINGTGGLYVEAGAFNVNGGSPLTDVYAQGSILTVAASETNTTLIYATGGSTTLATNLSPTTTVQVEGISSDTGGLGTAILTLAGGATNAGTIVLQSYGTDGYNADSDLAVAGGTIFTNTGIIQVNNSAGSRFITGNFVNAGTINVVGVSLQVNKNASSYSFTQSSGSINGTGGLYVESGAFNVNGGSPLTDIYAQGSTLTVAASETNMTLIYVIGSATTLATNLSPTTTIQVEGISTDTGGPGNAVLTLGSTAVNAGTLLLQSAGTDGYNGDSDLLVPSPSSFTNTGTIQLNASAGLRYLLGTFINQGVMNLAGGVTLVISGNGSSLTNASGGTITASGTIDDSASGTSFTNASTLVVGPGATLLKINGAYIQTNTGILSLALGGTTAGTLFDQFNVTGQAVLDGTLNISLIGTYTPKLNDSFKVLTFASVAGSFATYTFPTLSGGLVFVPTQTATSLTLNANMANLLFLPTPTNVMAGVPFTLNVTAKTPSGSVVTGYAGNVTIKLVSGPTGGILIGTKTVAAINGVASFTSLTLDSVGGYMIQATATSLISATTNPFTVTPGVATQLVISAPSSSPVVAGSPFTVTGTVEDAFGDVVTGDSGNVTIVLSNGSAGSLGGSTTVAAINGVATFSSLTLSKVSTGNTLTISRSGVNGATTSSFAVIAAAASQLVITSQQPATGTAGVAFDAIAVAIQDAYGNPEPASGGTLTATLASGSGTLLGTTTVNASGGVATFSNLLDDSAGPITIQFSGLGLAGVISTPIVISPTAATRLMIATQPSPTAGLGQPFATQPVIDEVDQYGNIETGDSTTTVTVSLNTGVGPLTGTTTVTVSSGVARFTDLANGKIETISLGFSGGGLIGATSNNIIVGKTTPVITWSNPANIVYGTPLSSTQLNATASIQGSFVYSQPTGTILIAGLGQTLTATFTPTDTADYATVTTTVTINVTQALPVVTWSNPANIVYGTPLSSTQFNASTTVAGTFVYSPLLGTVLKAGQGQTLTVTFTPTDTVDYTIVITTVTINVLKAAPVVTWSNPANITYGTPLGSTQFNASTTVAGTFVYSPLLGTILKAGQGQTLTVTFTPTDTVDYTIVITTVTINVNQAAPLVTWAYPAAITYGTPLGSTQLNATTTIAGTFTYSPLAGTILKVGAGQTLLVTFTPTDAVDYSIARSSVTINVIAATTGTALSIAPAAATFGLPVVLTATISGTPGAGMPTGSVSFLDGNTILGSATLDGTGHAVFSTTRLLLGTQAVTATYSGDSGNATSTSSTTRIYVGDVPKVDFDGDGKVDLAVFGIDPNTGRYDYRIINSSTGKTVIYDNNGYGYGNSHSIPIVGDFFGDGRASYALWTPNAFGGMTFTAVSPLTYKGITINFGSTTDLPVVADVNGDGIEDFGVYGFQTGLNYRFDFVLSSYNFNVNVQDIFNNNGYGYGGATSIPIVADFDGSGKAGFGIYNPSVSGSTFAYVNPASGVSIARTIGTATDTPTAVDYDGDGKADLALYGPDPTKHGHYRYLVLDSSSGFAVAQAVLFDNNGYGYGNATSLPVMGDYEGNGKADFGLFTSDGKGGNEFVYLTGQTGSGVFVDFATATDIPLTAPTYLVAKKVRGY